MNNKTTHVLHSILVTLLVATSVTTTGIQHVNAQVANPGLGCTVLIFEPSVSDGTTLDQSYGDGVASTSQGGFNYGGNNPFTPNITASYATVDGSGNAFPADVRRWTSAYGDLTDIIYSDSETFGILEVTLTADPGGQVILESFDMGGWSNTDYTINSVSVLDGSDNPLTPTQMNVLIHGDFDGPLHTDFDFSPALVAQSITIRFDSTNLGSGNDNIGIDNIRFCQSGTFAVPAISQGGIILIFLLIGGVALVNLRYRMQSS